MTENDLQPEAQAVFQFMGINRKKGSESKDKINLIQISFLLRAVLIRKWSFFFTNVERRIEKRI